MTRTVIAHISDLHFGNEDKCVLDHLTEELRRDPRPDFIVVTGDLSQLARRKEFEEASKFLKAIVAALAEIDQPSRVIVIPGNHDLDVYKGRKAWKDHFGDWNVGGIDGGCRPGKLEDFHMRDAGGDRAKAEERAKEDWKYCEYYPQCQIAFLKFDSNRIERHAWQYADPTWVVRNYARGQVGSGQIEDMKKVLARYRHAYPAGRNEPAFEDARKIALVHHHVHYLPNEESDSIFLMLDAGLFWRNMIELGVEMILHGHKHYPTHEVIRYMTQADGRRGERELIVLSAGTALSKSLPRGISNSYYRLEADVMSCRVQHRRHQGVGFEDDGPPIVFRRDVCVVVPGSEYPIDGAALEATLIPDKVDGVDNLVIEEIQYQGSIDKDLGYGMDVTYAGRIRRAEQPYLTVPLVVVNAPVRQHTLQPNVTDLLAQPNQPVRGVRVEKSPDNVRKLLIHIPLPQIHKGDEFRIRLGVHIPATMYDENDFDAKGLLRYRHGPEKFSYVLRSEREPLGVQCFAVHRSGLTPLRMLPISQDDLGWYVIRPQIGSVATLGIGLLCHYQELLPMPSAPTPAGKAS